MRHTRTQGTINKYNNNVNIDNTIIMCNIISFHGVIYWSGDHPQTNQGMDLVDSKWTHSNGRFQDFHERKQVTQCEFL